MCPNALNIKLTWTDDPQKELELMFAGVELSMRFGQIAVSSMQSMNGLGVLHSTLAVQRHAKQVARSRGATKEDRADLKFHELTHKILTDAARGATSAAGIIYAHAIVDAALYKLCEISATIDSPSWVPFIKDKRVSFQESKADPSQLEQRLIAGFLTQLERESLIVKADHLFKIVRPKTTRGVLTGFRYSRDRLLGLDQLRHDLVHKMRFCHNVRQPAAKAAYLFKAGDFFHNLLAGHYGVRHVGDQLGTEDFLHHAGCTQPNSASKGVKANRSDR